MVFIGVTALGRLADLNTSMLSAISQRTRKSLISYSYLLIPDKQIIMRSFEVDLWHYKASIANLLVLFRLKPAVVNQLCTTNCTCYIWLSRGLFLSNRLIYQCCIYHLADRFGHRKPHCKPAIIYKCWLYSWIRAYDLLIAILWPNLYHSPKAPSEGREQPIARPLQVL